MTVKSSGPVQTLQTLLLVLLLGLTGAACRSGSVPDLTPDVGAAGTPSRTPPDPGSVGASVSTPPRPEAGLVWCTVETIVDGDTFDAGNCDEAGRVRLILLDAPESTALCFASEATSELRSLMPEGSRVGLERDVSNRDRYGRLLRYVWNDRGLVDAELVRAGWAWLAVFPPDVKYRGEIAAAEEEARQAGRGVWGDCPLPSSPPAGGCDPSYPTVCIPPAPPDLGCREVPYRRFKVVAPDPHNFDGDGDGIGCEGPPG